jgi:hypothetical protein
MGGVGCQGGLGRGIWDKLLALRGINWWVGCPNLALRFDILFIGGIWAHAAACAFLFVGRGGGAARYGWAAGQPGAAVPTSGDIQGRESERRTRCYGYV